MRSFALAILALQASTMTKVAVAEDYYLGMREGDLDGKPYAKYWNPVMSPLQEQTQSGVVHGTFAQDLGFDISNVDMLLEPGYLPLENGYTLINDDNTYFVACLTKMPGVTAEMIEWWFGWHPQENQRYKLWHPQAHVAIGTPEMHGDNPNLTNAEKYMTTHYATEFMGTHATSLAIEFSPPTDYFIAEDLLIHNTTAILTARIGIANIPNVTIGYIVHQIREHGTTEMRSRFWLGGEGVPLPDDFGRNVLVHCGMEMNHLSSFLPQLFADYHDTSESNMATVVPQKSAASSRVVTSMSLFPIILVVASWFLLLE